MHPSRNSSVFDCTAKETVLGFVCQSICFSVCRDLLHRTMTAEMSARDSDEPNYFPAALFSAAGSISRAAEKKRWCEPGGNLLILIDITLASNAPEDVPPGSNAGFFWKTIFKDSSIGVRHRFLHFGGTPMWKRAFQSIGSSSQTAEFSGKRFDKKKGRWQSLHRLCNRACIEPIVRHSLFHRFQRFSVVRSQTDLSGTYHRGLNPELTPVRAVRGKKPRQTRSQETKTRKK